MTTPKQVYVYIDETGDRGNGPKSSPVFGMAAVIVDETTASTLRAIVDHLRETFKVPDDAVMSWKKHLGNHDRRRYAAKVLGGVSGLRVCYVWAVKEALSPNSYVSEHTRFYNQVALRTYKAALWAARDMHGTNADVHFRFGQVRSFDHASSSAFIGQTAARDSKIPDNMVKSLRWVSADQYRESEAADLFGGFLAAAVWPKGELQIPEGAYLREIWPAIRKSPAGCAIPLGLFAMPNDRSGVQFS